MTVFQSSLASYFESRDEFALQVCDYTIYVLQGREKIRESLRKFSNLDYESLLLCIEKEVDVITIFFYGLVPIQQKILSNHEHN